jgi:hypothetical protein
MKYLITFILLLFVSVANANTPIQSPDWVLGKGHPSFPDSKYLIGVGVSEKSPVSASEFARIELIKTIRVQVNSVSTDYNSREKSVSESSIVSETDFLLEGSQVKDGWYDAKNNLFYSFVIIERKYVLETLKVMIEHILASIELSLRQADTFFNNGNIIQALIYYYDGYKESSKLLPYIQTYNSVIMINNNQVYKDEYNLLFKEKIQNIVDNIYLEKQTEIINNDNLDLNIKASFKERGIKNFPIKFSSGYNHYVERVLCDKTGNCKVNPSIRKVINRNNNILIEAEVDLQTLEKYFNHNLKKNLFGRLELLNVVFRLKKEVQKVQVIKPEKKKYVRNLTPWERCCANDIAPLRNRSKDLYDKLVNNFKDCVRDGYFGPEAKDEFKQAEEKVKEHNENEKQKVGKLTIEEGDENETK